MPRRRRNPMVTDPETGELVPLPKGKSSKVQVAPGGAWKEPFLEAFRKTGVIQFALDQANVARGTMRRALTNDPEFKAAYEEAKECAIEGLELEARRRAMDTSDTLLIFLLKAARPEVYRENHSVAIGSDPNRPLTLSVTFADLQRPGSGGPMIEADAAYIEADNDDHSLPSFNHGDGDGADL